MGRKNQQRNKKGKGSSAPLEQKPQGWLVLPMVLLLLVGLGTSAYLTHLHVKVHAAGGGDVQSFCAISEGFNCITVATSKYSVFLGIPVAVWGLEFFGLALLAVAMSGLGLWSVRRWDSLLFVATAVGVPACAILAWISVSCINSVCIMCLLVYGVTLLMFILLLVANRGQIGRLITTGPKELVQVAASAKGGVMLLLVVALGISQFFWLPRLTRGEGLKPIKTGNTRAWIGLPTDGLTLGPKNAPVRIEEFTDFECPYCGKAHEVMMQVIKQFPGKIHLVHRDYPLDMACNPKIDKPFHHNACLAAYYARCVANQGKYWPFEALLFKNRERLEDDHLKGYARQVGVDPLELKRCVSSPTTTQAVRSDIKAGTKRKVRGTPSVFVNGEMVVGLRKPQWWVEKIKTILKGQ